PASYEYMKRSVERTSRRAERSMEAHQRKNDQALFGIIQGGEYEDLRKLSVQDLISLDFPGYAIGGLSVGEPKSVMNHMLEETTPMMPQHKPRYLMGVCSPDAQIDGAIRGIEMSDCVIQPRLARDGTCMTSNGRIVDRNAKYAEEF